MEYSEVDLDSPFCFIGKTDEEKSLVCLTQDVPENATERDDGWRAFRIDGILGFSLIGILSGITSILAQSRMGSSPCPHTTRTTFLSGKNATRMRWTLCRLRDTTCSEPALPQSGAHTLRQGSPANSN